LQVRADHLSEIGFSTDCANLLAGTYRHNGGEWFVERWDSSTSEVKFRPRWFDMPGIQLSFDPEPKVLAGRNRLSLADLAAVQGRVLLPGAEESVTVLGLSPDGRVMALVEGEDDITIRDARTGKVRTKIEMKGSWDAKVMFTPDGEGVITWKGRGDLVLWNTKTGAELKRWEVPGYIRGVRLTPDGKEPAAVVYLVRHGSGVVLWDVQRGEQIALLHGCSGYVDKAVFSPDGQTFATSGDCVRLWDAVTGHPRGVLRVPLDRAWYIAFRPDSRALVAAGFGTAITLWTVPPK
jgi:WD40 repeat protein